MIPKKWKLLKTTLILAIIWIGITVLSYLVDLTKLTHWLG